MEGEKTAIHAEYEQERIAYQKLLKEYNMLEAVNDDLKEKVNMLRGGELYHLDVVLIHTDYCFTWQISMTAPSAT